MKTSNCSNFEWWNLCTIPICHNFSPIVDSTSSKRTMNFELPIAIYWNDGNTHPFFFNLCRLGFHSFLSIGEFVNSHSIQIWFFMSFIFVLWIQFIDWKFLVFCVSVMCIVCFWRFATIFLFQAITIHMSGMMFFFFPSIFLLFLNFLSRGSCCLKTTYWSLLWQLTMWTVWSMQLSILDS